jgi:hypothetical protein
MKNWHRYGVYVYNSELAEWRLVYLPSPQHT